MISLPAAPGSYAFILRLERPASLKIGRLGEFQFPTGDAIYLGSAMGPGGLRARLGWHLKGQGQAHWHVDYLRTAARVVGICYALTQTPLECLWSQALASLPQALNPAPGFGASDCRAVPVRCPAHLVIFPKKTHRSELLHILAQTARLPQRMLISAWVSSDSDGNLDFIE